MIRFILTTLFTVLAITPTAKAGDNLTFQVIGTNKQTRVLDFIEERLGRNLINAEIAAKDLNDDVLDEFIMRHDCTGENSCRYTIIALEDLKPIVIGQFDAHQMQVSAKKSYGIHDLIVYNASHNDFQNQTARWNPFQFSYQLD